MINTLCGGNGRCGKCRVNVSGKSTFHEKKTEGINSPTKIEMQLLGESLNQNVRLACQVIPRGKEDLKVTILDLAEYQDSIFKIQDTFTNFQLDFAFNPRIDIQPLSVAFTALENTHNDFYRLSKALEKLGISPTMSINLELLSQISNKILENNGTVYVIIDRHQNQLIGVETQKIPLLGVVVDVGTTSIVATLIDLETGSILGANSIINPQIEFGRDIMSRLGYALTSPSKKQQLQLKVLKGMSELLLRLTSSTRTFLKNIYELVIVGNSVMHHLFLNLPVVELSRAPFVPTVSESLSIFVKDLDIKNILKIPPKTIISMPPLIGGFIGSDAVADILYISFSQKKGVHLLIDFGTNSEIILLKDNNLYAASVAAGGAFEGQHITCGMRGITGAIEKFKIINGSFHYQTINSDKPKGICGTGIIDILAELFIVKQLDFRGQIFNASGEKIKKIIIVPANYTSNNQDIYLNRKDIEAIQKAKAATIAAIRTLTAYLNIEIEVIESIHIAGVFGSKLDIDNAKIIGLLPNLANKRFVTQGNTAEKGGRAFLLSMEARELANSIVSNVKRLELTNFPKFQSYFSEELFFPRKINNTDS